MAPPPPPSPSPVSRIYLRLTGRLRKGDSLLMGEAGEVVGRGAESYDRKKAWSSINHSIHSDILEMKFKYLKLPASHPESIATLPPFGPIEGQKWFDQTSSR
jgi:hypothetical protein